jgi:hypothetical protein
MNVRARSVLCMAGEDVGALLGGVLLPRLGVPIHVAVPGRRDAEAVRAGARSRRDTIPERRRTVYRRGLQSSRGRVLMRAAGAPAAMAAQQPGPLVTTRRARS